LPKNPPSERLVAVPKSRPKEADERSNPRPYGVGEAFSVALSPDGKLLAAAAGGAVRVWKVSSKSAEEWAVIHSLKDSDRLDCLALSPDGKTLAIGGYDCRGDKRNPVISLWDLTASPPREVRTLSGVERSMHKLAFSGDGKTLFSISRWYEVGRWTEGWEHGSPIGPDPWRKVVRWDVVSGRLLDTTDILVPFNDFALAPDGRHLLTANKNGTAYLFRLPPAKKAD